MDEEAAKRNFSRVPLSRVVRFRDDQSQAFRSAPASNISMGGMYIATDVPYAVGTRVYLQFMLENGDIVAEGWGRVVHNREDEERYGRGMGLEFVSMDEKLIAFAHMVVSEELIQSRSR